MKKLLLLFFVSIFSVPVFSADSEILTLYTFNDFEVGYEFPVVNSSGKQIYGAKAVIETASSTSKTNKLLHVINPTDTIGYVALGLPEGRDAIYTCKKYERVSFQLRRPSSNTATETCVLEILFGSKRVYADSNPVKRQGDKLTTYNCPITKVSTNNKQMRIALLATPAEFFIDNVKFYEVAYNIDVPEKTVRYWADQMCKNFGTCVNPGISTGDNFGKTVAKNFNTVVLENSMKFDATEPNRNQFNWNADGVVTFAQQNNMKVRGHTLTWHGQNPDWVSNAINAKSGTDRRKEAISILKNHIFKVVGHWKGKIAEWDVVNECLNDGQNPAVGGGYSTRNWSVWYTGFGGEDYIDSAFVWAHQADPDAKLYLNDYSVGMWNKEGKTRAMYNLAKRLKDAGIPIDGVGFQTHTSVGYFDPSEVELSIKQFQAIGLNVIVTEMDMEGGQRNDKELIRAISDSELKTQAEKYGKLAEILLKYDCPTFMVWGVADNRSWLDCSEDTKPLLFYADLTPHEAYITVRKAYQNYAIKTDVPDVEYEELVIDSEVKLDVYSITGQKVGVISSMSELQDYPAGFYIVGNKKYLVK